VIKKTFSLSGDSHIIKRQRCQKVKAVGKKGKLRQTGKREGFWIGMTGLSRRKPCFERTGF
jgi:hypothetical protein